MTIDEPKIYVGSPQLGEEEAKEIVNCVNSRWWGLGPRTDKLERLLQEYLGTPYVLTAASGTAALGLAVQVFQFPAGGEVIIPSFTFPATANVVVHAGLKPVFVDSDPNTLNIDPGAIAAAVTPRTVAIIPVHTYGYPCDMATIGAIARQHHLAVIEDAAHALEGRIGTQKIGTISDATMFSMDVTKNVAAGMGGIVCFRDPVLAERARTLSYFGIKKISREWYDVVAPGYKYNFIDILASLAIVQLQRIEKNLVRRTAIWQEYNQAFSRLPAITILPEPPEQMVHSRHLYTVKLNLARLDCSRLQLMEDLFAAGIDSRVRFPCLHLTSFYRHLGNYREGDLPVAEDAAKRVLSLPLNPDLTEADVNRVIRIFTDVVTNHTRLS